MILVIGATGHVGRGAPSSTGWRYWGRFGIRVKVVTSFHLVISVPGAAPSAREIGEYGTSVACETIPRRSRERVRGGT